MIESRMDNEAIWAKTYSEAHELLQNKISSISVGHTDLNLPKTTESEPGGKTVDCASRGNSHIVAIGISLGGPKALTEMLPLLPSDIGVPILVAQHMLPGFTKNLAQSLNDKCLLTVKEAEDDEFLRPNTVFIAPGGYQMKVTGTKRIRITDEAFGNNSSPSIDCLFNSVASHFAANATAVIMTGMGRDGIKGLQALKSKGALIIAQDESTSIAYGMPKEAVDAGIADIIAPLSDIALEICRTLRK